MKIIKKGNAPKPKLPPWTGKRLTCSKCGTIVELEGNEWPLGDMNGNVYVSCPICYNPWNIYEK